MLSSESNLSDAVRCIELLSEKEEGERRKIENYSISEINISKKGVILSVIVLITAVFLFCGWVFENKNLIRVGSFIILFLYIFGTIYGLFHIIRGSAFKLYINGLFNPLALILSNVQENADRDEKSIEFLASHDVKHLKFALMQARQERDAWERRVSLMVGAIDKIGLLPGALAAMISIIRFEDLSKNEYFLLFSIVYGVLCCVSMSHHLFMKKLDRYCEVMDFVINLKEEEEALDCQANRQTEKFD